MHRYEVEIATSCGEKRAVLMQVGQDFKMKGNFLSEDFGPDWEQPYWYIQTIWRNFQYDRFETGHWDNRKFSSYQEAHEALIQEHDEHVAQQASDEEEMAMWAQDQPGP